MVTIMMVALDCLSAKRKREKVIMLGFIITILLLGFTAVTFAQNSADNIVEVVAKGTKLEPWSPR